MTQIGLEDRDGDFDVDVMSVGSLGVRQLRHGKSPRKSAEVEVRKSRLQRVSSDAEVGKLNFTLFTHFSVRPYF